MKLIVKSAFAAIALAALTAGSALAADCCCKDKDGKMTCCDKKAPAAPATPDAPASAPQHQH
ncbi:hypothetical protein [Phenylobacterium sp.]|uniref:hypothetical protein n=1 Tax=Phenylobacterium sp. TaxID=1871053 RepID=UPI00286BBFF4|nr:hypothetical protein [Phenylobacterium sp.]